MADETTATTTEDTIKTTPADPAGADGDEAALWAEFDRQEGAEDDAGTPPDEGRTKAGDIGADATPQPDETTAATGPTAPAPNAGASAKPQGSETPSLWDSAPPELRSAYESLTQEFKRRGQEMAELRQVLGRKNSEIETLRKASATSAAATTQEGQTPAGILGTEDWKRLREEYPEIAAPLEKQFAALERAVVTHGEKLAQVDASAARAAEAEIAAAVEAKHPNYVGFIAEHGDAFLAWRDRQPRHVREAIERNWAGASDADELVDILDRFKSHLGISSSGSPGKEPPVTAGTPNPLADRRKRQLDATVAPKSRGPSTVSGIPEDADEKTLWKMFEDEERRAAAQRR